MTIMGGERFLSANDYSIHRKDSDMNRNEVYREIKETLGLVPKFMQKLPDRSLELEWKLFKTIQLEPSPIPNKYRELIGLGIAATSKCRYCTLFHTEVAKLSGATDEEIEDAIHYAKASAGWSAYLNGSQIDYDDFKRELAQIVKYVSSHQLAEVEA
jgi:AhpD family alkylhydroperoxidase